MKERKMEKSHLGTCRTNPSYDTNSYHFEKENTYRILSENCRSKNC